MGNSVLQFSHQVAQKLRITIFPRYWLRLCGFIFTSQMEMSGCESVTIARMGTANTRPARKALPLDRMKVMNFLLSAGHARAGASSQQDGKSHSVLRTLRVTPRLPNLTSGNVNSEPPRKGKKPQIAGEEGVAVTVVLEIGYTSRAISVHGDGQIKRPNVLVARILEARHHRYSETRSAESIALADQIARWNPLSAAAKIHRQAANLGKWICHTGVRQIRIRLGHDRFQRSLATRHDPIGVPGLHDVVAVHEEHGFANGPESLEVGNNSPATVTRLN